MSSLTQRLAIASLLALCASTMAAERPARLMPFLSRDAVVRESAERIALVGKGVDPAPTLVLGEGAPGPRQRFDTMQTSRAGTTLLSFFRKIAGAKLRSLPRRRAAGRVTGPRIVLATGGDLVKDCPELPKIDAHGFLIRTKPGPKGMDLHILSPSGTGVIHGCMFFLMNYARVRIVLPNEIGEVYEKRDVIEVPKDIYVLNPGPDYELRIWSGVAGFRTSDWLADSGGTQRYQYHHNCFRIFDPKRLAATHPEVFPVRMGKPFIPKPKSKSAWQPTFSHPSTAQRAVEYADQLFTSNPQLKSMSVSVNDGLGYSEADLKKGKRLPDGRLSISTVYYRFVNAVARGIAKRWPDKYVAFLPYNRVREAPDFKLEDNVMVFLFNEPKVVYERWQGKVKAIGVYQWLYGMGWVLPNHWPHAMQDYLRWVRARGGRAFKGEAYVPWAQGGPKMWVLNNLLWNTDADVDALLKDYAEHAYGKQAAPAMARYFARAEAIYERRRTPKEYRITRWHPGEYQFEQVKPEDIEAMSAALDEANRLAVGEANKTRVDMVTRAFRWGRLYWRQYAALKRLQAAEVKSETDVAAALEALRDYYRTPKERDAYFKKFVEPLATYCVFARKPGKVDMRRADPGFKWAALDPAADKGLGAVSDFKLKTQTPKQVAAYWSSVAKRDPALEPFAETQRLRILHPNAKLKNLLTNGGFEAPPDPPSKKRPWRFVSGDWRIYHNRMVNAKVFLDPKVKHSGRTSMTAKGMTDYSGVLRAVRVKNRRRYRLSFWYKTSPKTRHICQTVMLRPSTRTHFDPSPEWRKVETVVTVNRPSQRARPISFTILFTLRHGGSPDSQAWFDDVRIEMLAPEGVAE